MADSANIVDLILAKPLESLPYEEKLRIKQQGRSTPKIDLVQKIGKSNRSFQLSWYDKVSWLTGSAVKKKMYCWPCLLMKPSHGCVVWSKLGFGDLSNFDRAYKRHENSNEHVSACARLVAWAGSGLSMQSMKVLAFKWLNIMKLLNKTGPS